MKRTLSLGQSIFIFVQYLVASLLFLRYTCLATVGSLYIYIYFSFSWMFPCNITNTGQKKDKKNGRSISIRKLYEFPNYQRLQCILFRRVLVQQDSCFLCFSLSLAYNEWRKDLNPSYLHKKN